MENHKFNLKELSDRELFDLEQQIIAEEIRRVEEDPNAIAIAAEASIEEDLKALKELFNKFVQNQS
jgi:hypothetical protein